MFSGVLFFGVFNVVPLCFLDVSEFFLISSEFFFGLCCSCVLRSLHGLETPGQAHVVLLVYVRVVSAL